jgi:hypothetical protein
MPLSERRAARGLVPPRMNARQRDVCGMIGARRRARRAEFTPLNSCMALPSLRKLPSTDRASLRRRAVAAVIHLFASAAVAGLAALLVFALWYPMPFREVSGGRELFVLLVSVDVLMGPLITLAVFDVQKPRQELLRDISLVTLLQLGALAYGLHTASVARPAIVALEGDRLRVVRMIDLPMADPAPALESLRVSAWSGPRFVATRKPEPSEFEDALDRGLAGEDIGMRPDFWLPSEQTRAAFSQAAMPLDRLVRMRPERKADLDRAVAATGHPAAQLGYLPILARRTDWSALVDRRSGEIVGYVDIEGF